MSSPSTHLAAVGHAKAQPLRYEARPTPTPGPDDVLIAVHSFAFNPVDYIQPEMGFMVGQWPSVFGSDVAGTVEAVGSSVPADSPFKPGARVGAFATAFYAQGAPDYGGMQAKVLVPATNVTPLPDAWSFDEGSLLGMAVATASAGLYTVGVSQSEPAPPNKALLVWSAAASVGGSQVQIAKHLGFTVYATASPKHNAMVTKLGAARVFDYKDPDVVAKIVAAAKEDGVTMDAAYIGAGGAVKECMEALAQLKTVPEAGVASAPRLPDPLPQVAGVRATFVQPPQDAEEKREHFRWVFNVWLAERLAKGEYVPSPSVRLFEGGLAKVNEALAIVKGGSLSGEKLVVHV